MRLIVLDSLQHLGESALWKRGSFKGNHVIDDHHPSLPGCFFHIWLVLTVKIMVKSSPLFWLHRNLPLSLAAFRALLSHPALRCQTVPGVQMTQTRFPTWGEIKWTFGPRLAVQYNWHVHDSFLIPLTHTLTLGKGKCLWTNTSFLEPYHSVTMRILYLQEHWLTGFLCQRANLVNMESEDSNYQQKTP